MSEEALLIFKMVQEGKITPEQGVSLLDAITKAQSTSSNGASAHNASSGESWGSLSNVQRRLAEMQQRLGEMQAKIGAAQAGSSSSSSTSGSVKLPFGLGDFNVTEIIDEAVKGMNAIKAEATISAKRAARQAQKEARRFRTEAERLGKSIRVEVNVGFETTGRPHNTMGLPEITAREEATFALPDDGTINFRNPFGDVKITDGSPDGSVHVQIEKTVWGASRTESEERLRHIELSDESLESGREISVKHYPRDEDDLIVMMFVQVPTRACVGAHTGYGDIDCASVSGGVGKIQTSTGDIRLQDITFPADTVRNPHIESRSGSIYLNRWHNGAVDIETLSGNVEIQASETLSFALRTTSGDVSLSDSKIAGAVNLEATSGDIHIEDTVATADVFVKTQSGDLKLENLTARQFNSESASGDIEARNVRCTDGQASIVSISGDVQIDSLMAQNFQISTTSGDANIQLAEGSNGQGSAVTVSGDIELFLTPTHQAQVTLSTHSGTLRCAFPLLGQEGDGRQYLSGRIGDSPSATIRLQSVSGDLTIVKRD